MAICEALRIDCWTIDLLTSSPPIRPAKKGVATQTLLACGSTAASVVLIFVVDCGSRKRSWYRHENLPCLSAELLHKFRELSAGRHTPGGNGRMGRGDGGTRKIRDHPKNRARSDGNRIQSAAPTFSRGTRAESDCREALQRQDVC